VRWKTSIGRSHHWSHGLNEAGGTLGGFVGAVHGGEDIVDVLGPGIVDSEMDEHRPSSVVYLEQAAANVRLQA
jgi:hypothetical protein